MTKTILLSLAHPDDEILGPGGTIAKHAHEGAHVVLVCATKGEAGEIAYPELATKETLGEVREQEMLCAAKALGIAEVIFLGYRDSGMDGTPENDHPNAFCNAPAGTIIPRLVQIMRTLKPDVVITFEPYGGYGHPDHIAIHKHTVAAFDAAGDAEQYPTCGEPFQPGRLLYPLLPIFFFEQMRDAIAQHGGDVSDFNLNTRRQKGWPDDQIHIFSDVGAFVENKFSAWDCHRTQFGPNSRFRRLPKAEMMKLLQREWFAIARPGSPPNQPLADLFQS